MELVGGMWSQYFTQAPMQNQYTDIDSYNLPSRDGFVTGPWDNLYASALTNYQYVIDGAKPNQIGSTSSWER